MKLLPDQVTAVVLAGGFGTRIQHLLPNLPKPMAPVVGKPFLEWVVRFLARQEIQRVILSTGHLAETVERHFAPQPVKGVKVSCVVETKPLGTAGGFLNAIKSAQPKSSAWLVLNGDSLALGSLEEMFKPMSASEVEGVVLGVPMDDASRYGTVAFDDNNELVSFNEKKPGAGIINAGVYLFPASTVESFPKRMPLSFEKDVFPALAARKARLKVCVTQSPFLDIGTPDSLPLAAEFIRGHLDQFTKD